MTKDHYRKLQELKELGVGWYIKFEVNTVMKLINCMIYNKKQELNGKVEKVSIWNTMEEGIDWLYAWKTKDQDAMNKILKRK